MAEEKDRIQKAADALGNLAREGTPQEQPEPAPDPGRAAEPPTVQEPPAGEQPSAVPQIPAVRVYLKRYEKVSKRKRPRSRKQKKPKPPPAPPPVLTPLERTRRTRQIELRRMAIPVLLTMGLAMLVLGCWSVAVLAMRYDFFHPRAEVTINTTYVAKVALLAWPIAAVLLLGMGLFIYEVYTWFRMYPAERKDSLTRRRGDAETRGKQDQTT